MPPASVAVQASATVPVVVKGAWAARATCGAVRSTVKLDVAGVGSTLPLGSTAAAASRCGPSLRPLTVVLEEQLHQVPPSTWQRKLTGTKRPSKPLSVKRASVTGPAGPYTVVSGGVE